MSYLEFRSKMVGFACFNINQVYAWHADFDRNNLTRWVKNGYLIKLRQGWYAFSEYKEKKDYSWYFANKMYAPSYISLYSALAFYGLIPEAVMQISSVSSLKTISFRNDFGEFTYRSVKDEIMFGYERKPLSDGRSIQVATPEKAIIDLLYLYPFYKSEKDMLDLRMDEDFLHDELNRERLLQYTKQIGNNALSARINMFIKTYEL